MTESSSPSWSRSAILAVAAAAFIVTISMGIRQSFGLLMQPMGRDLGLAREAFGFAIALQNLLFGLVQPFVAAWSERLGTRRTLILGAIVYLVGLVAAAMVSASAGLIASIGVLVGLALSGTTFVIVLGAVGRLVEPTQRSVAFGIVTAGGSLGQFAVVPFAQALITGYEWRTTLVLLGLLALTIVVAAFGFPRARAGAAAFARAPGEPDWSLSRALRHASRHPHYWLLNGGFFVCGFHIAFVGTHLPAYLVDRGIAPSIGAWSLALIGLFNIAGSYLFGVWGARRSRPLLLAALYGGRAVAIALFIALPLSAASALVFAAAFGFLWLGTVPLTSGAVASMFGLRHLSTLNGVVFLSHQVGAFFGAWWAGLLFDRTGSYDAIWYTSIALGLVAAGLSAATRDRAAFPVDAVPAGAAR
ncbi:MFS transporter [Dokdonella sp. MW10]|uniref:MFS transporter n=1 Tax=Dokdonella sp. MW10 TaxID=2992926 RepID=UPI003F7EC38F